MIKKVFVGAVCVLFAGFIFAQQLSTTPAHRLDAAWWEKRFNAKKALADKGEWEVVFLGDSITQGWERSGKEAWNKYFSDYKILNLGYSGDRTDHVLWRIDNGELDKCQPKLLIMMIGTNNTGHRKLEDESPQDTADGIKAILERLKKKLPQTRIVLLAIFPRDNQPDGPRRVRNNKVNEMIKQYADGKHVVFMDINSKMLEADGTLTKEMMPDFLHPKELGYNIWAEAMVPVIKDAVGR